MMGKMEKVGVREGKFMVTGVTIQKMKMKIV